MKTLIKKILKRMLQKKGLSIVRAEQKGESSKLGYISAEKTLYAAQREGLSVCDYVEKQWKKQGDTQKVIDSMMLYGAFAVENPVIVEIGTGSGRYLEKTLQKCNPAKYESYETARDWAEWLQSRYPIISLEADGYSLRETSSRSADLVHAHGVFVYLPFFASFRYWMEVWRVTKDDGFVIFDIISEECLEEKELIKWLNSDHNYPVFLSKDFVGFQFSKHGFSLIGTFKNRYDQGFSEYLVFKRDKVAERGCESFV